MSRTIIVSNRLPIKISNLDKSFEFSSTSGGLATGMKSIHKKNNFLWIGWPGIDKKSLGNNLAKAVKLLLKINYNHNYLFQLFLTFSFLPTIIFTTDVFQIRLVYNQYIL